MIDPGYFRILFSLFREILSFFCSVENPVWENYGHLCVYIKVQIGLLFHLFYANEWELVFSSKGLRGEGENRFQQEVVGPC